MKLINICSSFHSYKPVKNPMWSAEFSVKELLIGFVFKLPHILTFRQYYSAVVGNTVEEPPAAAFIR